MWATAEVRWFFSGLTPEGVGAWFSAEMPRPDLQPSRVDHYLIVRDTDGLGIKFREGRIEVKQRYDQGVMTTFADDAAGTIELWRKWGFGLAAYARDGEIFETLDAWVAVQKARQVRNYAVMPDGKLVVVPRSTYPHRECSVELTEVLALGDAWWTLGFEAMGAESTLRETLTIVARHVLTQPNAPTLDAADAYGYPRWLQLLGV